MLIESLVRLGRPVLRAGLPPGELLKILSSVLDRNAANMASNVLVVEIERDTEGHATMAALPPQIWKGQSTEAVRGSTSGDNTPAENQAAADGDSSDGDVREDEGDNEAQDIDEEEDEAAADGSASQNGRHSAVGRRPRRDSRRGTVKSTAKTRRQGPIFVPDVAKLVGAAFQLPFGGNRAAASGPYAVPSYPVYSGNADQIRTFGDPEGGLDALKSFLKARTTQTIGLEWMDGQLLGQVAQLLQPGFRQLDPDSGNALILLAELTDTGPYGIGHIRESNNYEAEVGLSQLHPGYQIVARLDQVLARFWQALRLEGSKNGGSRVQGTCAICHHSGPTISAVTRSWPLMASTWSCPLPAGFKDDQLVDTMAAVCPDCHDALVLGARLVDRLERQVRKDLVRDLFSPVNSALGRKKAQEQRVSTSITGVAFALPILSSPSAALPNSESQLEEAEWEEEFVDGLNRLISPSSSPSQKDLHLDAITGFESILPEQHASDRYRLTLLYYSGNKTRADVHLRALIEDVLPSMASRLTEILNDIAEYAVSVNRMLSLPLSTPQQPAAEDTDSTRAAVPETVQAALRWRYGSLLYLLSTAYGSATIWDNLQRLLRGLPVPVEPFVHYTALRLDQLAHGLSDSDTRFGIRGEVLFYLTFGEFLRRCSETWTTSPDDSGKGVISVSTSWQEMARLWPEPPEQWQLKGADELGFLIGIAIARFGAHYYAATAKKEGGSGNGKDFLVHRVMTFGSDLTPDAIWGKGLARIPEYSRRLDIHLPEALRQRIAILTAEYQRLADEVRRHRDLFIASFWSGHELANVVLRQAGELVAGEESAAQADTAAG
ncbi:MAG: hypothetical protein IMX01_10100 [Limnochordaceae bacterium]|nr:hypothetical protein [Limnochordaceae bacterium]